MDLTYTYGQLLLSPEISAQCYFFVNRGKVNGNVPIQKGLLRFNYFDGGIPKNDRFVFIDILITTKGLKIEHISTVEKLL